MPDQTSPETNYQAPQQELELSLGEPGQAASPIFTFIPTGIAIRDDITVEEYKTGLRFFKQAKGKLDIGFSQYVSFGKLRFGNESVQAMLGQLEFPLNDVRKAVQIASVPEEIKHPDLTSDHYIAIAKAKLTKPQQKKWARIAQEQRLNPTELKASIDAGEVVTGAASKQRTQGIISPHGIRMEMDIWLRRVGGLEGILKMSRGEQEEILNEISPIVDLGIALREKLGIIVKAKVVKSKPVKKGGKKAVKKQKAAK